MKLKETVLLCGEPQADAAKLREAFGNSFDLSVRALDFSGHRAAGICLDGMCDENKIADCVLRPLRLMAAPCAPAAFAREIRTTIYQGASISEVHTLAEAAAALTQGCYLLLIEGAPGLSCAIPGYCKKSVDAPQTEMNESGAKESFTDRYKDNAALLRLRLPTERLVMEKLTVGSAGETTVLLCYLRHRAQERAVSQVRRQLTAAKTDLVSGAGVLKSALGAKPFSLFSPIGQTERPDMLAAKLAEGRIGVIADGSPFALIVPYVLADHFHSIDDYMITGVYAAFLRVLRVTCFLISAVLPGLFVAVCVFHPETLPAALMLDVAAAEARTPFTVTAEAAAIHLMYEVVREAGLRMPKALGHAVSIVGALVVGEAAVSAGLVAAPMLMVVALTAISSAVTAKLQESTAPIRLGLILLGGSFGFFGIFAAITLLFAALSAKTTLGVAYTAPLSPFIRTAQADGLFRLPSNNRRMSGTLREMQKG